MEERQETEKMGKRGRKFQERYTTSQIIRKRQK